MQSRSFGYIPLRTTWGAVLAAVVLGLLCLVAPAAASALFSLAVAGNNLAWGLPILARAAWGRARFVPGPVYTGDALSLPIAWAAVAFLAFGIVLAMFPAGGPGPAPASMNYTVVVNVAVWGGCSLYYFVDARRWFAGPRTTVDGPAVLAGGPGPGPGLGRSDGGSGVGVEAEKQPAEQ